jgi:lactoylglutathione lyase
MTADREPAPNTDPNPVREMRLVVTADDYEQAIEFFRDVLGLPERAAYSSPDGRVVILEAGRATLEIADPAQAEFIDTVEVGRRVAGPIRVAFEVADSEETSRTLVAGGATLVAGATPTPWGSLNARLDAPGGLHMTLFSDAPPVAETDRAETESDPEDVYDTPILDDPV